MRNNMALTSITAIGLVLTILLSWLMFHYELDAIEDNFSHTTNHSTEVLKQNLQNIKIIDEKLSLLFQVNQNVTVNDFLAHTQGFLFQFPFIEKIIYAPKIRDQYREIEEKKRRYEGYTGFKFRTFSETHILASPFNRIIFPVKFIQPFNPYTSVWFGKDLLTFESAATPLKQVVLNGNKMQFAVPQTPLIKQNISKTNEIYLFSSVYYSNGEVGQFITSEDIFGILGYKLNLNKFLNLDLDKHIPYKVTLNNHTIFKFGAFKENKIISITRKNKININEQTFVLEFELPKPLFEIDYRTPGLTLILGGIITIFAFFIMRIYIDKHNSLNNQNRLIEEKVVEKTKQLKSQAQKITKAYDDQLIVTKELEAFSYSISHDLRAPLRSICGFASIIIEDHSHNIDTEANKMLKRIENAAKKMSGLIDDLLSLSQITRQQINMADFSISDLASELVNELYDHYEENSFHVTIAKDLNVVGDRNLIRIVLMNLMSNAVKYSEKTDNAKIEFGIMPEKDQQVFYVQDNGVGFDMTYANKLFVAFQRLHGAEYEGTGIGLAIVQRIINRHGGKIWAESHPGNGATFYFTLTA